MGFESLSNVLISTLLLVCWLIHRIFEAKIRACGNSKSHPAHHLQYWELVPQKYPFSGSLVFELLLGTGFDFFSYLEFGDLFSLAQTAGGFPQGFLSRPRPYVF